MSTTITSSHILAYPFPASGHVIPFLDLTRRLLNHGLIVTVLVTPKNLHLLDSLISKYSLSSIQSLVLQEPVSSGNSVETRFLSYMRGLHELHYAAIVDWFKSQPSPPIAILSDFMLGWTQELANELGVQRIIFSPSSAYALSIEFSMWAEMPKIDEPDNDSFQVSFPKLPNCPIYPSYQVSQIFFRDEGNPDWEFLRSSILANRDSSGLLFNSFAELERVYIEHMKKEMGHNHVWAIGPLLPAHDDLAVSMSRGGSSSEAGQDVMTWLNTRRDHSVVYICFGSVQMLTTKQMSELAAALEKAEIDFIWCMRLPNERHASGDYGILPDAFKDRVASRGYIIKGWAPQVPILRHRAVGAFLTHCGWNSILEGISAGVMMLTWPMGAEQFASAQLLVDQLGVGIRFGEGTHNIPKSSELARLLAESLDENRPERLKAQEMSSAALSAVVRGGSSDKDFDDFIECINQLKIKS